MTKNQVKSILISVIDNYEISINENSTLTPEQLTELTDLLAVEITDTVNPNGPCYPSTPR